MKLRSIYLVTRKHIEVVGNFNATSVKVDNRPVYKISNWLEYNKVLLSLLNLDFYCEKVECVLREIPEYFITKNEFILDSSDWQRVERKNRALNQAMKNVIELYESMGLCTDKKIGIDIKLPSCNDFSEYVKYITDLEFIFSKCPFLQLKDEKLVFDGVDVGSDWITLLVEISAVGTVASVLLNNLVAFIDKCIIIRSHYLETQKQKADLEKEKTDATYKESILHYIDSLYSKSVQTAIEEMEVISGYNVENKDGDEPGRIRESFERMGKLIDKGLQIYSTIDAPEETKLLFQPLKMHYDKIEDKLKFIEKKDDEE